MNETLPLNVRVAPVTPVVPEPADGIQWRPATLDDVDAIMVSEHAQNAVDHPHYRVRREEMLEELTPSWVDLSRDTLLAVTDDGTVAAWGHVLMSQGQATAVRAILNGGVHPDHRGRGLGRALLTWQDARGIEMLAGSDKTLPGRLILGGDERQHDLMRLGESLGYRVVRYYLELRRDLSEPIETVEADGYEIVTLDRVDTEKVRQARNDSFQDHWGSQPVVEEAWAGFMGRSTLRPDLSYIAVTPGGDVAGFVLGEVNEEDFEPQGFSSIYVDLVGVVRAHRGRGLARALLSRSLRAAADAGLDKMVLDVDSESLTGATRLYDSLGFTRSNRSFEMHREV